MEVKSSSRRGKSCFRRSTFLDELAEFPRSVLESLRQPLEDGVVSISRAQYRVEFKTDFIFIGASNPCPCGFLLDDNGKCNCTQTEINKYMKKISGPIMDRIDLHVEMRRLTEEELMTYKSGESSKEIKERVLKAREIQKKDMEREYIMVLSLKNRFKNIVSYHRKIESTLKSNSSYGDFS